jgi:membrane protein
VELNFDRWERSVARVQPTLRYWMEVEAHVYAFSVAANVLLSFFPFLIVLVSVTRYVLHWGTAEQAIYVALRDYFPGDTGDFLVRNLTATVASRGIFQWVSVLLLLFTANGVFEPLEVALNRAWGIAAHRSYVKNQLVSLGLIFACGILAVVSTMFTAINQDWISRISPWQGVVSLATLVAFKLAAIPASILVLFLVYWLLPNGPVPARLALRTAVYVGLVLEGLKYLNLLLWPWLRGKLQAEYGPFVNSATILVLSFVAAMIVMAGAEWAGRHYRNGTLHNLDCPARENENPVS